MTAFSGMTGTTPTGQANPIGTNIDSSCKFTRAGESAPIKSSILAGWISNVATKEGIPPAIMASVARHENPDFTKNADDNHDAIKNNYYYIVSQLNQDINKETNAIGLMQISTGKTPTQNSVVDHCPGLISSGTLKRAADNLGKKLHDEAGDGGLSYYCTSNLDERIQKLCQTTQIVKNKVIYTPDSTLDDSYLNLCRIQDNLAVSIEILKGKIGSGNWQKETDVKGAIGGYYGGCLYPGGDYCTEVWQDVQNCQTQLGGGGTPTICSGTPVSFGVPKKFLPLPNENPICLQTVTTTCGRPGTCASNPSKIVLHTTSGDLDAEGTYQYFANGSDNRGVGAHFIIGKDGQALQIVETLDQKVEVAWAVAGYSDHISIEIVQNGVYNNKTEVPLAQYQAIIKLVKDLMKQYNIPVGNLEYNWQAPSDAPTSQATPGVYGHYQLNPQSRADPGAGFLRDIRQDLK